MLVRSWIAAAALLIACLALGCGSSGSAGAPGALIVGQVRSGDTPAGTPLADAQVTLFLAGETRRMAETALASTTTDANGQFALSYAPPARSDAVLYLVAEMTDDRIKLAAVLADHETIVINERTTVAAAFSMAQFIDGNQIGGRYPGPQNAAETAAALVDVGNGHLSSILAGPPNGTLTPSTATLNSLANMVAACIGDVGNCATFFTRATAISVPTNTLDAMISIAQNPGGANAVDAVGLYASSAVAPVFAPALTAAPDVWILVILFHGDGVTMNGPGNIAFDVDGNVWVNNNYSFSPDPLEAVCGDDHVIKLTPGGRTFPGGPYQGGGLYGAGFGICLDPNGDVWVSNYGFQGFSFIDPTDRCYEDIPFLASSVSQFTSTGVPLSPGRIGNILAGGYATEYGGQPQGIVSDRDGNIWVSNTCTDSVSVFPGGGPSAMTFPGSSTNIVKPFGAAVDAYGNIWFASNNTNSAFGFLLLGAVLMPQGEATGGIDSPMGIATDSLGNIWVANSGVIETPCDTTTMLGEATGPDVDLIDGADGASVTVFNGATPGTSSTYGNGRGGLYLPWGIAVDGLDNVWVANFGGNRITHICGARPGSSLGLSVGDAISPDTGYTFDGLVRNTGIQIAPSGNVWCTNNWATLPFQTNPGGKEVVCFVGLADPVETPLLGAPRPLSGP